MMKGGVLFVSVFMIFLLQCSELSSQVNQAFYEVIRSSSGDAVHALVGQLEALESPSSQDQVYLGALYMRMADFQKVPAQKLASFKQGRDLLEQEIEKQPKEVEFRFVRMIIQEQAPAFLKYNGELEADKGMVLEALDMMEPELKKEVELYLQRH